MANARSSEAHRSYRTNAAWRKRGTRKKAMSFEAQPLGIRLLGLPEVSFEGRPLRSWRREALSPSCKLAAEGGRIPRRSRIFALQPGRDAVSPSDGHP